MGYKMGELLQLVSELAQKYGGYESTSITCERAQTLMGAVLYCLEEYNNMQEYGMIREKIPLKEQYDTGVGLVYAKAQKIQKIFNELSSDFESYGVKCLSDTVQTGIPEFLRRYDVIYNPQDAIITPDYPVLIDCSLLNGADAVYRYILAIQTEQLFLRIFGKKYVNAVLRNYNAQYEDMIENICDVVLSNTIGHVVIKKPLDEMGFQNEEYLQLAKWFREKSAGDIEETVTHTIKEISKRFFAEDQDQVSEYLCHAAKNIAVRMEMAARSDHLYHIFVI